MQNRWFQIPVEVRNRWCLILEQAQNQLILILASRKLVRERKKDQVTQVASEQMLFLEHTMLAKLQLRQQAVLNNYPNLAKQIGCSR